MVTEVVKELEAARAKVAELENSLAKAQKLKLAGLPREYGFDNLADFIKAIKGAGNAPRRGRGAAKPVAAASSSSSSSSSKKQRSKRARITPEVKEKVKSAVNAGKTGAEIAKEFGISVPSVQNIKKEFGLVKARG